MKKVDVVTLELTEEQARVITKALDLFMRIRMGQIDELLHICDVPLGKMTDAREAAQALTQIIFPDMSKFSYYSIYSDKVGREGHIAHDLCTSIRHDIAWATVEPGQSTIYVDYDPVMPIVPENQGIPLNIRIKVVEKEEEDE